MTTLLVIGDIVATGAEYEQATRRAAEMPDYRLTWRARNLAYRKARGQTNRFEAIELRAIAAEYKTRTT